MSALYHDAYKNAIVRMNNGMLISKTGKRKTTKKSKKPEIVNPRLNFVVTTYYKGTGMEEVLKKLEQYLDNCDKSESTITTI